jgi:hypothetical protein
MENLCVDQNHIFQLVEVWQNFTKKKKTLVQHQSLDGDRPPTGERSHLLYGWVWGLGWKTISL